MVPKAGLYQRGFLKSLKTWAIPAPDEAMVQLRHLGIKGWSTRNSFDSVALTNTGITPVLDEGGVLKIHFQR